MNKILMSVMIAVLITVGAAIPYIVHLGLNIGDNIYGCDGIELFYTGKGFAKDWLNLTDTAYLNCEDNVSDVVPFKLYEPKDILSCKGKPYDCEDLSHAVYCLAKKYNVSCEFYTQWSFNEDSHRGIKCMYQGQMRKFN